MPELSPGVDETFFSDALDPRLTDRPIEWSNFEQTLSNFVNQKFILKSSPVFPLNSSMQSSDAMGAHNLRERTTSMLLFKIV